MSGARVTGHRGQLDAAGLRRVVAVLSLTQITSWGVLYYAFPVLTTAITADTGWSATGTTAAFSAGQVTSALVGIAVGRGIDRWGPRGLMSAGSLLAGPAVVGIALAPTLPVFFLAWVVAGFAMALVLYPPAFAAVTQWGGDRRVQALTAITLAGGLASTVFAPLTAALGGPLSWRGTYLVLAGALLLITLPAHWLGLRQPWVPPIHPAPEDPSRLATERAIWRSRPYVLLAMMVSVVAFCGFAVVVNLVPMLVDRGLSLQQAAFALGLGGAGQVAGRFCYGRLAAHTSVVTRSRIVFGAMAASIAGLALLPGPFVAILVVSTLAGAARGVFTLLQATAVSDRWGLMNFGHLNGLLSAPATFAAAVAPWAGAALAHLMGGHPPVFLLLAGVVATMAVLVPGTVPAVAEE